MSLEILKNQLKTGEFANLYVIYGNEDYLKTYYCKKITDKAVSGFESFNLQKFDGTPDMAKLAAAVNNLPLMSEKKCVVIRDADISVMRAGDWKELREIINALPPECILIFHFDAMRLSIKKDTRFKSLVSIAEKNGLAVEINSPSKREMIKFIAKRVRGSGCDIDESTAEYIIETCGEGMNTLACEVDKLCACSGGGTITKAHVDAIAVKPMTSSIYDLARAVSAGNLTLAMDIIDELFYKKEEPVIILSALSGAFCDLYRAKAALISGVSEKVIANDFNYRGREFRVRNAVRDARNMDITFLANVIRLLMEADAKIKSTMINKRTVLEKLVIEIGIEGTKTGRR